MVVVRYFLDANVEKTDDIYRFVIFDGIGYRDCIEWLVICIEIECC